MSDYWVSKKKYWCKYCDVYIADDAPSRNQHEGGMRHQGNKERYVRNLYKTAERKKKDDEEEAREMKRIETAAQAAYAVDVGAGRGSGPSGSTPSSSALTGAPKPKQAKTSASYTTAADLGIVDEDEVKRAAEAAVRQNEGRIGAWEVVTPLTAVSMPTPAEPKKRPPERDARNFDDDDDTHAFQVKKRKLAVGLGDIYDPGVIAVGRKVAPPVEEKPLPIAEAPRWAPLSLAKGTASEVAVTDSTAAAVEADQPDPASPPQPEPQPVDEPTPDVPPVKLEPQVVELPAPAPSMFRKRKGPSATANRSKVDA